MHIFVLYLDAYLLFGNAKEGLFDAAVDVASRICGYSLIILISFTIFVSCTGFVPVMALNV